MDHGGYLKGLQPIQHAGFASGLHWAAASPAVSHMPTRDRAEACLGGGGRGDLNRR
jgi:hypothetical protein